MTVLRLHFSVFYMQSVVIKMGKKSEQISIDKKEFGSWWSSLQQAYCFGESLELDEEEDLSKCGYHC